MRASLCACAPGGDVSRRRRSRHRRIDTGIASGTARQGRRRSGTRLPVLASFSALALGSELIARPGGGIAEVETTLRESALFYSGFEVAQGQEKESRRRWISAPGLSSARPDDLARWKLQIRRGEDAPN